MKMEVRVCMNGSCASPNALEWENGWPLRSGEFAVLCDNCGAAYKQSVFCETFHSEDTGWRECDSCGKRLHCGCIASSSLLELLETGGVNCIGCSQSSKLPPAPSQDKPKQCVTLAINGISLHNDEMLSAHSVDDAESDFQEKLPLSQEVNATTLLRPEDISASGEIKHKLLSSFCLSSNEPSIDFEAWKDSIGTEKVHEGLIQTNLCMGLSSSNINPLPGVIAGERDFCSTVFPYKPGLQPTHLLPQLSTSILAAGLETHNGIISQFRVARPPVEGRIKNQLLPRYWPRITDQELQQISGDSNSTIIPLFEKVLSASDAGRIGRLVLPKACAEAYFPAISQPEGLPLRIQDVKGNEWIFQFRFWPNNNSRMYVLEGVTPCIHSMELHAGDTVIFSRMDPEGKLLMGFRKASSNTSTQQMLAEQFQSEPLLASVESLPMMSGYPGLHQPLKESRSNSMTTLSKHFYNPENSAVKLSDSLLSPERKQNRNIGAKNKRLLIDDHDALELKLSWEEVQDMLRPPPSVKPSTVTVEDHEIEEFEEPPVFGKRSIFAVRASGEHEQWAQCDICFKWRKLPADFFLPPKWTCLDYPQDPTRCSCSVPNELSSRDLENLLSMDRDFKKRRVATSLKSLESCPPEDQKDLTGAGAVNGDTSEPASVEVTPTTKHPRHRPGCSCIVCIQPPSGKGKHKPTCICNVCLTVKRRFKTLMMRKKKRQSEREAEITRRNQFTSGADDTEVESIPWKEEVSQLGRGRSETELIFRKKSESRAQENADVIKGGELDLNIIPDGDYTTGATSRVSMVSLLQEASLPLETYLKQNGLRRLVNTDQASSVQQQVTGEATSQARDEGSDNECSEMARREDDPPS